MSPCLALSQAQICGSGCSVAENDACMVACNLQDMKELLTACSIADHTMYPAPFQDMLCMALGFI